MSKISRLFEMLGMLRARRRPVTALELAEELGVSERSVYRDVETLRLLGAPLDGQAGVGFVLREGFFLPNFAFSPEELDALVLGLGWVRERADHFSSPEQRKRIGKDYFEPDRPIFVRRRRACSPRSRFDFRALRPRAGRLPEGGDPPATQGLDQL